MRLKSSLKLKLRGLWLPGFLASCQSPGCWDCTSQQGPPDASLAKSLETRASRDLDLPSSQPRGLPVQVPKQTTGPSPLDSSSSPNAQLGKSRGQGLRDPLQGAQELGLAGLPGAFPSGGRLLSALGSPDSLGVGVASQEQSISPSR